LGRTSTVTAGLTGARADSRSYQFRSRQTAELEKRISGDAECTGWVLHVADWTRFDCGRSGESLSCDMWGSGGNEWLLTDSAIWI